MANAYLNKTNMGSQGGKV